MRVLRLWDGHETLTDETHAHMRHMSTCTHTRARLRLSCAPGFRTPSPATPTPLSSSASTCCWTTTAACGCWRSTVRPRCPWTHLLTGVVQKACTPTEHTRVGHHCRGPWKQQDAAAHADVCHTCLPGTALHCVAPFMHALPGSAPDCTAPFMHTSPGHLLAHLRTFCSC